MRKGWKKTTLGELGRCINGVTYSPSDVTDSSGLLVLRSSNVQSGRLSFDDNVYVSKTVAKENLTQEGDILVCVRNGSRNLIGKNCLITSEGVGLAHGAFMTLFRANNPDFVYQLLQTDRYYNQVRRNLGATINSINTSDFYEFTFLLPPIAEQKKIAAILRTWDDAIEKAKKARTQKQKLFNTRRRYLTNPTLGETVQEKNLSEISTEINRRNNGLDAPVMMISSTQGFIRQDENYDRDMAGDSLQKYILLKEGEFAYNKGNSKTYPYGCIFRLGVSQALIPFVYICFRLSDKLNPRYFRHYFQAGSLNRQLIRLISSSVRGNGLLNINSDEFFSCKIPIPSKVYQDRCADFLDLSQLELDIIDKEILTLTNQKRGLMQKLLTGEWPVTTFDKEAA